MAEQHTQTRVLRVFGPSTAQVSAVLREAAAKGCPGLRLLGKDGEFAVCITARTATPAAAEALCGEWEKTLRARLGAAVFAVGERSLPQAALDALLAEGLLLAAADEATGTLLGDVLRPLQHAEAAFDFGTQSYADPKKAGRIEAPTGWLRRWPNCPVQPVAGAASAARRVSGADWGAAFQPAQGQTPAFVVLAGEKGAWLRALTPAQAQPAQAARWLLDIVRRAALGLEQAPGTESFRLGQEAPAVVLPAPAAPVSPVERLAPAEDDAPARVQASGQPTMPIEPARGAGSVSPAPPPATHLPGVRPSERLTQAAQTMYGLVDEEAMPESSPKRRGRADPEEDEPETASGYWGRIGLCVFLTLLVVLGAALGVYYWNHQGDAPAWRSYGTADFDADALAYLQKARQRDGDVAAYLALSGQPGALVYAAGTTAPSGPAGAVLAAGPAAARVTFAQGGELGAPHSNPVIYCPASQLEELGGVDTLEAVERSSGFTLYTEAAAYRFKVAAVFYWDPDETGDSELDLLGLQDLSNYDDYLTFVLGIKARSLFDMPVDLEDDDCFVSLVADSATLDGTKLVVVGRQVRASETASVDTANIAPVADPLLPAALYRANGSQMPDMLELNQIWLNWYITRNDVTSDTQQEAGMPQEDLRLDDILNELGPVPTLGPIPTAGPDETQSPSYPTFDPNEPIDSGNGGTPDTGLPSVDPTLPPITTPEPTAAHTPAPTGEEGGPTPAPGEPTPEPAPTPAPTEKPRPTINVTMNGTAQTMDLAECLAMIVQNEIGSSAPAEAQKAQAIAAHSWILSQGGYPSVSGRTPTASVRANAEEVASLVVTYNNSIAFTPYFASASTGTASSKDVWGGVRPYLVEVDSPYDQSVATNWKTVETYPRAAVAERIQTKLGITPGGDPSSWFEITGKTTHGWVTGVRICGSVTKSGTYVRSTLLGSLQDVSGRTRTMRSQCFTVAYDAGQDAFVFTVYGYGHGCGMSQWGAIGYARNGWTYQQILAHYYPGTGLTALW